MSWIEVNGTILDADSNPAPFGTVVQITPYLSFTNQPGIIAFGDGSMIGSPLVQAVDGSGAIALLLRPNSESTNDPDSYYRVDALLDTWYIQVPAGGGPYLIKGGGIDFNPPPPVPDQSGLLTSVNVWIQPQYFKAGKPWVDVEAFGATGDIDNDDTEAIQEASDTLLKVASTGDGQGILNFGPGDFNYSGAANKRADGTHFGQVMDFQAGGGIIVQGAGSGATRLRQIANLSDPLFSCLGRHGTPDSTEIGPWGLRYIHLLGDRTYTGDAMSSFYQSTGMRTRDLVVEGFQGRGFSFTAGEQMDIEVILINCGRGNTGDAAMHILPNDEGGNIGTIDEVRKGRIRVDCTGSDDHGIFAWHPTDLDFWGRVEGSGSQRSCVYLVDPLRVSFWMRLSGGSDDCLTIQSNGGSAYSYFGGYFDGALGGTPGTGYGLNMIHANAAQTHTKNVIDGFYGTEAANVAGNRSIPGSGGNIIANTVVDA